MGAEFAKTDIVPISRNIFDELKKKARYEKLRRYRFCLHKSHDSPIQEMVIALGKGSYVQPHRHPNNRIESYGILEGAMKVLIFDDKGTVINSFKMDESIDSLKILRIGEGHWHMPIALSDFVVYHEILQGPFSKDTVVEYASWAPSQDLEVESRLYLDEVMSE